MNEELGIDGDRLVVITVVHNDADGIQRTINSLLPLKNKIFHLVLEKQSDLTSCVPLISQTSSESQYFKRIVDSGIYDAFNQALEMIPENSYCYFLNAGDEIINPEGFLQLANEMKSHGYKWGYASVEVCDRLNGWSGSYIFDPFSRTLLTLGFKVIHQQACIYSVSALKKVGKFDSRETIAADMLAHFLLARISRPHILNKTIARFYTGGLSSVGRAQHLKTWQKILKNERPVLARFLRIIYPISGLIWSQTLKRRGKIPYV